MKFKNPPKGSIGLCLSGGGFRASLFHLGVLRYLAEVGQLRNVGVISSVSGGSIIAAYLATKWNILKSNNFSLKSFMKEVYNPFTHLIITGNLRNHWVALFLPTLPFLLYPRFTWIKIWVWLFDRWFYGRKKLKMPELPAGLELVINTTDLHFAKAYRFSQKFHGSDVKGYSDSYGKQPVRVSEAVTASAAHLPFYRNIACKSGHWFLDGGGFDNCGLDWFLDWEDKKKKGKRPENAVKPSFLIVSEASAELTEWRWGWRRFIPLYRMNHVLKQYRAIQYEQTRRTRKDWFIDRIKDLKKDEDGIIISIDVVARELEEAQKKSDFEKLVSHSLPRELVEKVQKIRTDLNNFLQEEADLLSYHGYRLTHIYLTTFHGKEKVDNKRIIKDKPLWKLSLTEIDINQYISALRGCSNRLFVWKRRLWCLL
ncbi:patatin-like phospholipase family protein [candidate division WOR-3 bacterium]|nr:patatin-like phospholipase family protein [candidate division WOR-3 bacterium]